MHPPPPRGASGPGSAAASNAGPPSLGGPASTTLASSASPASATPASVGAPGVGHFGVRPRRVHVGVHPGVGRSSAGGAGCGGLVGADPARRHAGAEVLAAVAAGAARGADLAVGVDIAGQIGAPPLSEVVAVTHHEGPPEEDLGAAPEAAPCAAQAAEPIDRARGGGECAAAVFAAQKAHEEAVEQGAPAGGIEHQMQRKIRNFDDLLPRAAPVLGAHHQGVEALHHRHQHVGVHRRGAQQHELEWGGGELGRAGLEGLEGAAAVVTALDADLTHRVEAPGIGGGAVQAGELACDRESGGGEARAPVGGAEHVVGAAQGVGGHHHLVGHVGVHAQPARAVAGQGAAHGGEGAAAVVGGPEAGLGGDDPAARIEGGDGPHPRAGLDGVLTQPAGGAGPHGEDALVVGECPGFGGEGGWKDQVGDLGLATMSTGQRGEERSEVPEKPEHFGIRASGCEAERASRKASLRSRKTRQPNGFTPFFGCGGVPVPEGARARGPLSRGRRAGRPGCAPAPGPRCCRG
jgi:hypothetical protein